MFEKFKNLLNKFNKKENEEIIESKNKPKIISVASLVLVALISIIVVEQLGLFKNDANINSSSNSSSSSSIPQTLKLDEEYIVEDFEIENFINKKNGNSLLYEGLRSAEFYYTDFIDRYNSYNLKLLEEVDFNLDVDVYIYNDETYTYLFDSEAKTLNVANKGSNVLIYKNINGIVEVTLTGFEKYLVVYEDNSVSFTVGDEENPYIFEIQENDWTLTYTKNSEEYVEHYTFDTCSLLDVEKIMSNKLYHCYVYDEIKGTTRIEKSIDTGEYLIYLEGNEEGQKTTSHDDLLLVANYYIIENLEVYIDNQKQTVISFVILDSYLESNGLPFSLGR